MAREPSAALDSALTNNMGKFLLVQIDKTPNAERYAFCNTTIYWNNHTWEGINLPMSISSLKESDSSEAHGLPSLS